MCEIKTRNDKRCPVLSHFHVHIRTVPQMIGHPVPDTMEREPAGRSVAACSQHVGTAIRQLSALDIRYPGVLPTVAVLR